MNNLATEEAENTPQRPTLDDLIEATLEKGSLRQKAIILFLSFHGLFVGISHLLTSFHVYSPEFSCTDKNFTACDLQCPGIEFEESDVTTIVTEWLLICDRRYLSALVNTLYFVGVTFGPLISGHLADLLGRKPTVFGALYIQAILGASLYFAPNLETFIAIRVVQGFFAESLSVCSFTMMQEFCGRNHRTVAGKLFLIFFTAGLTYLSVTTYFVTNWKTYQLISIIPDLLTLVTVWFVPESPRWLMTKKKYEKAFKICHKLDKSLKDVQYFTMDQTEPSNQSTDEGSFTFLKSSVIRKHLLILSCVFFSVTLANYGIYLYLPSLAGDRHLNYFISSWIQIFALLISYPILKRFGRIYPMTTYQLTIGSLLLILGLLAYFVYDQLWSDITQNVLAQLGLAFITAAFATQMILGSELFPTSCRGTCFGFIGFWSMVGSLVAPQIILLEEFTNPLLPLLIIALWLFASGTSTLLLPETLKIQLPNSIADAEEAWYRKHQ